MGEVHMKKKVKKLIKKQLTGVTLVFGIIFLIIGVIAGYIANSMLNKEGETIVKLIGDDIVRLEIGDTYTESGFTFIIDDLDYT